MPTIITRGAASAEGLGWATASLGAGAWIGLGYDSSRATTYAGTFLGLALDASNNIYLAGGMSDASSTNFLGSALLVKLNSFGVIQFQKRSTVDYPYVSSYYGVGLDSSGNIYVGGQSATSTTNFATPYWAKYDSTGALQSQTRSQSSTYYGSAEYTYTTSADSSGNIYVFSSANNSYTLINKYSTTGTTTWINGVNISAYSNLTPRGFVGSTGSFAVRQPTGDIVCPCFPCYLQYSTTLIFYNANAVKQWQVSQRLTFSNSQPYVDSSNNVYFIWSSPGITKHDSTGTLQWYRLYSLGGNNTCIATDSSGNVYACYGNYIVKYNSSGSIQWQRSFTATISGTTVPFYIFDIKISSDGFMVLCGRVDQASGSYYSYNFAARLPINGSKTGTYTITPTGATSVVFTYSTASGTDSAGTFSNVGQTVNTTSQGISTIASVPTITNASLTETVTNIP